jgi:hypothetical protein
MNTQRLARNSCHRFWAHMSPWSAIDLTGIDRRGVIVARRPILPRPLQSMKRSP